MLASELIAELQRLIAEYGDCPVYPNHDSLPEQEIDTAMAVGPSEMTHVPGGVTADCVRPDAIILSQH